MPRVKRNRTVMLQAPSGQGSLAGSAYTLWQPQAPSPAGVVVLHDAGSTKENHYDFARAAAAAGLACVCLDVAAAKVDTVVAAAALLHPSAVGLWGSGTGGHLALIAGAAAGAGAIVAIAPNGPTRLYETIEHTEIPILLLHAEGDQQVPVQQSRELALGFAHPGSRLIVVPGGHHGSVEHDAEIRAVSLRLLARELGAGG
jgi:dienelactone hydrolase